MKPGADMVFVVIRSHSISVDNLVEDLLSTIWQTSRIVSTAATTVMIARRRVLRFQAAFQ